ncbi:MAG: alcohol dehydrogenase catalytic domain-containing protein [Anaerolineales bacterium]
MKASLHTTYGPPDELRIENVEKPEPEAHEVLIKIHAFTVTTSDCNVRNQTFAPQPFRYLARMEFGFPEPKANIIGLDLAGEIEAIGQDVSQFQVGDQVFGTSEPLYGTHAEYICLPQDGVIAHKPVNMTFDEAATVPVMGNTAYIPFVIWGRWGQVTESSSTAPREGSAPSPFSWPSITAHMSPGCAAPSIQNW